MLVTNTIYGSYQYLQYNKIEPRNGRPVTLIQCCYNKLQQCFKEFNYCDGWKPRQFMIHWYSNFIRDRSRKKGHEEVKRESDNDDDNSTTIPSKRRTSNPNVRPVPTKKVKKEIDANHDSASGFQPGLLSGLSALWKVLKVLKGSKVPLLSKVTRFLTCVRNIHFKSSFTDVESR